MRPHRKVLCLGLESETLKTHVEGLKREKKKKRNGYKCWLFVHKDAHWRIIYISEKMKTALISINKWLIKLYRELYT